MNKKRLLAILAGCVSAVCICTAYAAAQLTAVQSKARIFYKGDPVSYDLSPVEIDGKIYVPSRETLEKAGAAVIWDGNNQQPVVLTEPKEWLEWFEVNMPDSAEISEFAYKITPNMTQGINTGDSVEAAMKLICDADDADLEKILCDSFQPVSAENTCDLKHFSETYDFWELTALTDKTEVYKDSENTGRSYVFKLPAESGKTVLYWCYQ